MKFFKTGFLLFLLSTCLSSFQARAQEAKEPLKILFVGNSFTFFWNMPQLVQAMGEDQKVPLVVRQSTASGSNLKHHWKGQKDTNTKALIKEGQWDYVILGDHSLSTIDAPERFETYSKKFSELIRSVGAEPIFYLTWAYKSNPLMQSKITEGYLDLGEKLKAKVIPVGPIFMKARQLRPDIDLYFDDKHPSSDGSYLIGLIIYKALTGQSVSEIPHRVTTTDKDGEKIYMSFVLPKRAEFFRQLVEETDFEQLTK
ncbi:hypothetical protein V8G61_01695 [Gaetbulibacter sp. M240]|uniref:DUF4886 domain-containing protein n=1 Tax=Gaetbulibacter sp. M240 TaxID=3126511 RepID=UPI00374F84C6